MLNRGQVVEARAFNSSTWGRVLCEVEDSQSLKNNKKGGEGG